MATEGKTCPETVHAAIRRSEPSATLRKALAEMRTMHRRFCPNRLRMIWVHSPRWSPRDMKKSPRAHPREGVCERLRGRSN